MLTRLGYASATPLANGGPSCNPTPLTCLLAFDMTDPWANVHIERFLPLGALLAHCSLVLFHGGSGTLGHVINHGLPMVIVPLGADQPENADRCAELGISRTLDPEELAPESVRDAVIDVLRTPSYRQNVDRLRTEFERLPGVDAAVELLERLAREKVPVTPTSHSPGIPHHRSDRVLQRSV